MAPQNCTGRSKGASALPSQLHRNSWSSSIACASCTNFVNSTSEELGSPIPPVWRGASAGRLKGHAWLASRERSFVESIRYPLQPSERPCVAPINLRRLSRTSRPFMRVTYLVSHFFSPPCRSQPAGHRCRKRPSLRRAVQPPHERSIATIPWETMNTLVPYDLPGISRNCKRHRPENRERRKEHNVDGSCRS
jgi:hypothetical protein